MLKQLIVPKTSDRYQAFSSTLAAIYLPSQRALTYGPHFMTEQVRECIVANSSVDRSLKKFRARRLPRSLPFGTRCLLICNSKAWSVPDVTYMSRPHEVTQTISFLLKTSTSAEQLEVYGLQHQNVLVSRATFKLHVTDKPGTNWIWMINVSGYGRHSKVPIASIILHVGIYCLFPGALPSNRAKCFQDP
ncbi:hypothetical protein KEM54_000334 [Ascosphaera aggregata]|nr:hypothetical protein KEM54_000334 [Ascosphaera aggregata]